MLPEKFRHLLFPPAISDHHRPHRIFLCGLAALITLGGLGAIGQFAQTPLVMAPLGASAVLLLAAPDSRLARPRNQIGGHLIAALTGLLVIALPIESIWINALAVAATIVLMMVFRAEHPPAGAVPLVMSLGHVQPQFVLGPVLIGTVFLGVMSALFHYLLDRPASKAA